MNRLTDREGIGIKSYTDGIVTKNHIRIINEDEVIKKFHQIQKIEQELGIDLITLFKALKGRIYSLHPKKRKICLIIFHDLFYSCNQWIIGCHSMEWNAEENSCDNWDCFLKDYGKTWALTKEELEQ